MSTNKAVHRFAQFTAGVAFLTICAGGMVTSTGSGMADPVWPVSRPNLIGGLLFEHGHRMIATILGLCTLVLSLWLIFREPRTWVRRLGLAAFVIVACQGLLGALTVMLKLPPAVSIVHAALAEIFFCVMMVLSIATSRAGADTKLPASDEHRSLFRSALATVIVIFLQILVGAMARHLGGGYIVHVMGALVATLFVVMTVSSVYGQANNPRAVSRPALIMVIALGIQWILGPLSWALTLGKVISDTPTALGIAIPITLHVVTGAVILAASVVLAANLYVMVKSPVRQPREAVSTAV